MPRRMNINSVLLPTGAAVPVVHHTVEYNSTFIKALKRINKVPFQNLGAYFHYEWSYEAYLESKLSANIAADGVALLLRMAA